MKYEDLEQWSHQAAQWSHEYFKTIRERPVRSQLKPGHIASQISEKPPERAESMVTIFDDFKRIIPDGMTHWQHPSFFAYFSSNAAPASILAEQLANTFSAQCMLWQTSPAATELETCMVDWMRQALGLSDQFKGVVQDSATSSTLCAVLTMRERALQWQGNQQGLSGQPILRIYCSDQVHSSIDKAVRLSGIGQDNLVKIPTNSEWEMEPEALQHAIEEDLQAGRLPAGIIGCIGGTSIGASDNLQAILQIARQYRLYSHVDAAWAGAAMICEELRGLWQGIELADSIVVNPHKWLGANFDCSIQFLKTPEQQIRTVAIKPAYLETLENEHVTNYSEWVIPLGRRFRALKLWFLIRCYGLGGLRERIRNHIQWTQWAADEIDRTDGLEVVTAPRLSLFTFHVNGGHTDDETLTQRLLENINADGRIYLTQTRIRSQFVIRMTVGQFESSWEDVKLGVAVIQELFQEMRRATA